MFLPTNCTSACAGIWAVVPKFLKRLCILSGKQQQHLIGVESWDVGKCVNGHVVWCKNRQVGGSALAINFTSVLYNHNLHRELQSWNFAPDLVDSSTATVAKIHARLVAFGADSTLVYFIEKL